MQSDSSSTPSRFRACAQCGAAFWLRRPGVVQRFCSHRCAGRATGEGKAQACLTCGAVFWRPHHTVKRGWSQYCSQACRGISQRRTGTNACAQCGKDFPIPPPSHPKRFCSRACLVTFQQLENHWNWKGGIRKRDHQGPDYTAWRLAVFTRDGFVCQGCGHDQGHTLQAHHIKAWSSHPELRFLVDNGTTLCRPCHETAHTTRTKGRKHIP